MREPVKLFKQILLAISITSLILFSIPATSFSEVVFTPLGEITSGLNMPEDVAVSPDRKVYVVDGSQNRVLIYDANNQPIGNLSISKPTSVAVNTDGTIYIGTNPPEYCC
jgi:DNA-binding beta-propeller fold protein YncE